MLTHSVWMEQVHERAALMEKLRHDPSSINNVRNWLRKTGRYKEADTISTLGQHNLLVCSGEYFAERHNGDGKLLNTAHAFNTTMTAGRTDLGTQGFCAGTQRTTWYMGLILNSGTPSISSGDTLASHAGWTETTDYSGNRKQWSPTSTSAVVSNASAMAFTASGTVSVYGGFISTVSSGTSGILWSAGAFSAAQSLSNGQVLNTYYSLTLS